MFLVIVENILVGVVGLALLYDLGSGLCSWLPARLASYRWLLAPWAGYCLLVVLAQFLTNWPPTLTALQSAYVAVGVATVLNLFSIWRAWQSSTVAPSPP